MFTIFDTFDSYPMDGNDRRILEEMLEIAMKDSVFQWLKELPLENISFRFCPGITESNDVMGAFTILHPLSVFLRDDPERITTLKGRSFWIELLFPCEVIVVAHEQILPALQPRYDLCRPVGLHHGHIAQDIDFIILMDSTVPIFN